MLTRNNLTLCERITDPALRTGADRIMIDDSTLRVEATSALTRILTLGVDTSLCRRTLGIRYALGTTLRWNTQETRETRTGRYVTNFATLAVGSTRRWHARLFRYNWINGSGWFFREVN